MQGLDIDTSEGSGTGAGGHFAAEGEGGVVDIDPLNLLLQVARGSRACFG